MVLSFMASETAPVNASMAHTEERRVSGTRRVPAQGSETVRPLRKPDLGRSVSLERVTLGAVWLGGSEEGKEEVWFEEREELNLVRSSRQML